LFWGCRMSGGKDGNEEPLGCRVASTESSPVAVNIFIWQSGRGTPIAGPRIALPNDPSLPEFWEAIKKAQGTTGTAEAETVNDVIDRYLGSVQFNEKSEGTRRQYEFRLRTVRKAWGPLPAADLRPHHVLQLMDTLGKAGTKAKANNIRAALQAVSTWAKARNHIQEPWVNEGVERYELKGGHKPWTETQCATAEAKLTGWLRRAYYLGRYTGQRGSDVVRIGFTDIEDGMIHVVQKKTGVECWCPIEPRKWRLGEAPRSLRLFG
jgi:integrase